MNEIKKETYYFIMVLNIIAKKYNMSIGETYEFAKKHKGMKFLHEFYDIEHTLNTEDVVEDILAICSQNGGILE